MRVPASEDPGVGEDQDFSLRCAAAMALLADLKVADL